MLTDTQCRTAKPKDKPYKLTDEKGLHLEAQKRGEAHRLCAVTISSNTGATY